MAYGTLEGQGINEVARVWPAEAETLLDDLFDLRRAIHREPELGLQNPKTLAKIKDALAGLPLEFREGPSTTGLVAICLLYTSRCV